MARSSITHRGAKLSCQTLGCFLKSETAVRQQTGLRGIWYMPGIRSDQYFVPVMIAVNPVEPRRTYFEYVSDASYHTLTFYAVDIERSKAGTVRGQHIGRVSAIYQLLLGWKTHQYCYKTDELPNPRPTQPKKKIGYKWHLGHVFPQKNIFFVGWD